MIVNVDQHSHTSWLTVFTVADNVSSWNISFGGSLTSLHTLTYPFDPLPLTDNPCTPYLSIPTRIFTLDSAWESCRHYFAGMHDPPIYLNSENGFFPPVTVTTASTLSSPTSLNGPYTAQGAKQSLATKTQSRAQPTPSPVRQSSLVQSFLSVSKLPPVLTFGTSFITKNAASAFLLDSGPLTAGGKVTASDGTVFSMAANGRSIIIDGTSTKTLDPSYAIGTQIFSAGGPAVTIGGGTVVSVESDGQSVVIGGSLTEDISSLFGGASTTPSNTDTSSGPGDIYSSASEKIESGLWIMRQLLLLAIIGVGAYI